MILGEPTNASGYDVDMEVDLGTAIFVLFDEEARILSCPVNTTVQSDIGTYSIIIKLTSVLLNTREEIEIKLFILLETEEPAEETIDQNVEQKEAPKT